MAGIGTYKPIKLIKYITSLDGNGDAIETLAKIYKMWSEVKSLGGSRSLQKEQTALSDSKTFKIMFKDYPINADFKIQYFGQIYAISSIERIDEKRFNWLITAYNIFKQPALLPDPSESPSGGVQNWDSYTYDQALGTFTLSGGSTDDYFTRLSIYKYPYDGTSYVNAYNEGFSIGPFSGDTTTLQYFTPGQALLRWERVLNYPPYTVLTGSTEQVITITRLSRRGIFVYSQSSGRIISKGSFPRTVYNVEGTSLGIANSEAEFISLMNADPANQACFTIVSATSNLNQEFLIDPVSPYQTWGFSPIKFTVN